MITASFVSHTLPYSSYCSTASIVYETFLFGLMMIGAAKSGKADGFSDMTLVTVLVRDGTFAYLGVFCAWAFMTSSLWPYLIGLFAVVMLLNTILFTMAPTTLVLLGFP